MKLVLFFTAVLFIFSTAFAGIERDYQRLRDQGYSHQEAEMYLHKKFGGRYSGGQLNALMEQFAFSYDQQTGYSARKSKAETSYEAVSGKKFNITEIDINRKDYDAKMTEIRKWAEEQYSYSGNGKYKLKGGSQTVGTNQIQKDCILKGFGESFCAEAVIGMQTMNENIASENDKIKSQEEYEKAQAAEKAACDASKKDPAKYAKEQDDIFLGAVKGFINAAKAFDKKFKDGNFDKNQSACDADFEKLKQEYDKVTKAEENFDKRCDGGGEQRRGEYRDLREIESDYRKKQCDRNNSQECHQLYNEYVNASSGNPTSDPSHKRKDLLKKNDLNFDEYLKYLSGHTTALVKGESTSISEKALKDTVASISGRHSEAACREDLAIMSLEKGDSFVLTQGQGKIVPTTCKKTESSYVFWTVCAEYNNLTSYSKKAVFDKGGTLNKYKLRTFDQCKVKSADFKEIVASESSQRGGGKKTSMVLNDKNGLVSINQSVEFGSAEKDGFNYDGVVKKVTLPQNERISCGLTIADHLSGSGAGLTIPKEEAGPVAN